MTKLILTLLVLATLSSLASVHSLYTGEIPQRTKGTVALDLIFNICILIWAAILLSK